MELKKKDLENAASNVKSAYPEINDISNDIQSFKSNVSGLATRIKNEGLDDVSRLANDKYKNVKAYGKKIEDRVKDRPTQSMAIAFLGGLVASMLLSRR